MTLVDYGLGNVQAFLNCYKRLGIPARTAKTPAELDDAERIILPGVGAFDWAMTRLLDSGMTDCLNDLVLNRKRPILGVCVGMQMMARSSEEGNLAGLGWIDAVVRRLGNADVGYGMALPHMGWNSVLPAPENPLMHGLDSAARFYFLHSYYFDTESDKVALATTDYGGQFVVAVGFANICGVQFHPEKSHANGMTLLRNFSQL